jgi:plasmid segregation protein ParM
MATNQVHKVIAAAGLDIGFFSTKFTLGQKTTPSGSEIVVDQFPSLSPKSPSKTLIQLPNSAPLDAVVVGVDGVDFCVGKDVLSMGGAAGGMRAATLDYCKTPGYKSLFLGALFYMAKHIDASSSFVIEHLTLGLPLNTVFLYAEFLEGMATGDHVIPCPGQLTKNITVKIKNVLVLAQPQGAVVNYTSGLNRKIQPKEQALVLDMGGGTFDWFVCNGNYVPDYLLCGAASIGALACAALICEKIKPGLKNQPRTLVKVDEALRGEDLSFKITGVEYKIADFLPFVSSLLDESLQQMRMQVGSLDDMDHILLTGGGAGILQKVASKSLNDYKKIMVMDDDPVFSNVKGFYRIAQMAGR